MTDNLITCPKCKAPESCYTQPVNEFHKSYLCLRCGFQTNDLMREGEFNFEEYEQELQKQLKFSKNLNASIGLTGSAISGISKVASKIGLSGMADVFEEAREAAIEKAKALGVSETKSLGLIGKVRTMVAAFKVVGKEILKNLKRET